MEDGEDKPEIPVVTPVVAAAGDVPAATIHVGQQATELPHAALMTSIEALNGNIQTLNTSVAALNEHLVKPTVTEPVQDAMETTTTPAEVEPVIEEPPKERKVRRAGGRKVTRRA